MMPVYDYRCCECEEVFEVRRSMSESDKAAVCPTCHGEKTVRIYSAPNVVGGTQQHQHSSGGGCAGCAGASCSTCRN
ncbi:MAG: zinc ribbon domain-containing protein [Chloroflexi bacterium]|nr:zinc ribbon domain-containing protein [Chloroflexota bacterium]